MGHIAEPKGVDFTIKSKPLTDKERKELSEFIKQRKSESKIKTRNKKPVANTVYSKPACRTGR